MMFVWACVEGIIVMSGNHVIKEFVVSGKPIRPLPEAVCSGAGIPYLRVMGKHVALEIGFGTECF